MKYKRITQKERLAEMRRETAQLYAECDSYGQFRMKRDMRFPELPWAERAACRMYYLSKERPCMSIIAFMSMLAIPLVLAAFTHIPFVTNEYLVIIIRLVCCILGPIGMFHLFNGVFGDMLNTISLSESERKIH